MLRKTPARLQHDQHRGRGVASASHARGGVRQAPRSMRTIPTGEARCLQARPILFVCGPGQEQGQVAGPVGNSAGCRQMNAMIPITRPPPGTLRPRGVGRRKPRSPGILACDHPTQLVGCGYSGDATSVECNVRSDNGGRWDWFSRLRVCWMIRKNPVGHPAKSCKNSEPGRTDEINNRSRARVHAT